MTRLRILHVILSEGFKGSERSAAEYCNYLVAAGHEVGVVIPRWPTLRQVLRRGGVQGSIRDHLDSRVTVFRIPRQLFALAALRRVIGEYAPDVAHAHLSRATRLVAALQGAVATTGTLHMHCFDDAYLGLDAIFCVARWQQRLIPSSYRGDVCYTPNIVRPNRRLCGQECAGLRRELGIGENEFIIGGSGQLIERKGWDVLIRAFVKANLPDAKVLILGDGRQRDELAALGGDRVILPGFRSNAKDYLQIMNVFVCPSREEAFGLVLAEALDSGIPVIASRTEGCCEILSNFPGRLYPVDDVDALAALLTEHHRERVPRQQVALGEFLPQNAGATLVRSYETLLASAQRRGAVDGDRSSDRPHQRRLT